MTNPMTDVKALDPKALEADLLVAADETRDCSVCDGDGVKASGSKCGGCNGTGRVPIIWGKTNTLLRDAAAYLSALPVSRDETIEQLDQLIEDAVIGGTDDYPVINRASLLGDLREALSKDQNNGH